MSLGRRSAALAVSLAIIAAAITALYWQPIAQWLRPAPAQEKLTIAVINTYIGSGLVLVAANRGYFAAEGLEVTMQPHGAGHTALDAVMQNQADMTTLGNLPVIFATLDNHPLSIVASIARVYRGAGIVARRDRGINQTADLRGKTIGVTYGTDGHFLFGVILADHGIAPEEVKIVNIPPAAIVAALAEGKVEAIATWEPALGAAKKALGTSGVSFELGSGYPIWFHLAGRREFVQRHPVAMQKLLRALLRAEQYIESNPAAAATVIAAAIGMDPAAFDAMRPQFEFRLTLMQGVLTMLEDQARWAIANRYAKAAEPPNFLDTIYLDGMLAVRPESVSIIR
jgi:NitT/TauT family transport system substrate-binding protein